MRSTADLTVRGRWPWSMKRWQSGSSAMASSASLVAAMPIGADAGQVAGVPAPLLVARDVHTHELEVGVLDDAGDRLASGPSGSPQHDPVGHRASSRLSATIPATPYRVGSAALPALGVSTRCSTNNAMQRSRDRTAGTAERNRPDEQKALMDLGFSEDQQASARHGAGAVREGVPDDGRPRRRAGRVRREPLAHHRRDGPGDDRRLRGSWWWRRRHRRARGGRRERRSLPGARSRSWRRPRRAPCSRRSPSRPASIQSWPVSSAVTPSPPWRCTPSWTASPAPCLRVPLPMWFSRSAANQLVVVDDRAPGEATLPNLGAMPIAHRTVGDGAIVVAEGDEALAIHRHAVRLWQQLLAAALAGLGRRALEIAVDYVQERRAFGVLIANFQTIQHRLADDVSDARGRAAARLRSGVGTGQRRRQRRRARAHGLPVQLGVGAQDRQRQPALPRRLRVLARVRHPAVLATRQGVATRMWRPRGALRRARPRCRSGDGGADMDFTISDELAAHRDAAKRWVAANVRSGVGRRAAPLGPVPDHGAPPRCSRATGSSGPDGRPSPAAPTWIPTSRMAVFEAIGEMGFHSDGWGTTQMVARTIEGVGTDAQKQEYVAGALRGEVMIALGYSEPESGSDVAAAKTTAVRDGDEWIINGQKMFTSTAAGRHARVRAVPNRSQRAEAPRPHPVHGADQQRRLRVPAHAHARRSDHDHHVLQRRAHSRLGPHRRGERRLGRHGPGAGLRARRGRHHLRSTRRTPKISPTWARANTDDRRQAGHRGHRRRRAHRSDLDRRRGRAAPGPLGELERRPGSHVDGLRCGDAS